MVRLNDFLQTALYLALLNGGAEAFWRLPCRGVEGYARIDPMVDTGMIASHMHAIHGGNSTRSNLVMQPNCSY